MPAPPSGHGDRTSGRLANLHCYWRDRYWRDRRFFHGMYRDFMCQNHESISVTDYSLMDDDLSYSIAVTVDHFDLADVMK